MTSDGSKQIRIVRSPFFWPRELFFKRSSEKNKKIVEDSSSWDTSSTFITESAPESLRSLSSSSHSQHHQNNKASENLEIECLKRLKTFFKKNSARSISDEVIFRFACYHDFQYYDAFVALQDYHKNRRLHLRMFDGSDLLEQFQTKTLFPLPGLKTTTASRMRNTNNKHQCDVIYLRPSRHIPSSPKAISDFIDNLCYVFNDLSQTKEQCRNGVAIIANMNDLTMKNFTNDCCHQFMQALQGNQVPTKVELFLFVNPPRWFGQVWKVVIRPMLSKDFSKKVHIIQERRLGEFLMDGYEQHLPEEFANGWKNIDEMIEDLTDLKQYQDDQKELW